MGHAPQYIMAGLLGLNLMIVLAKQGQVKGDTYDGFDVLGIFAEAGLLFWGGFWG